MNIKYHKIIISLHFQSFIVDQLVLVVSIIPNRISREFLNSLKPSEYYQKGLGAGPEHRLPKKGLSINYVELQKVKFIPNLINFSCYVIYGQSLSRNFISQCCLKLFPSIQMDPN
jgi:hypothetical protein